MRVLCGICVFNLILQATTQLLFPTQVGPRLQLPLYLNNIKCRQCSQPPLPILGAPLSEISPGAGLDPAYQGLLRVFPAPAVIQGFSKPLPERTDRFAVQSVPRLDEGSRIEITQEEELILRGKSALHKLLSGRRRSSSLVKSILEKRRESNSDALNTSKESQSLNPPDVRASDEKALECTQIECGLEEMKGPLCACNFKTGNTVSFKNECDIKKHNCRFNTGFKTILNDICPWQFVSRSGAEGAENMRINYEDSRYYK